MSSLESQNDNNDHLIMVDEAIVSTSSGDTKSIHMVTSYQQLLVELNHSIREASHLMPSQVMDKDENDGVATVYERKRALRRINRAIESLHEYHHSNDNQCFPQDWNNSKRDLIERIIFINTNTNSEKSNDEDATIINRLLNVITNPMTDFFSYCNDDAHDNCPIYHHVVGGATTLLLFWIQQFNEPFHPRQLDRLFDHIVTLLLSSACRQASFEASLLPSLLILFNTNMQWENVQFPELSLPETLHLLQILLPQISKQHFNVHNHKSHNNYNNSSNLKGIVETHCKGDDFTLQLLIFVGHILTHFSCILSNTPPCDQNDQMINDQFQMENIDPNQLSRFHHHESQQQSLSLGDIGGLNENASSTLHLFSTTSSITSPQLRQFSTNNDNTNKCSWIFQMVRSHIMMLNDQTENCDDEIDNDYLQNIIDLLQSFLTEMILFSTRMNNEADVDGRLFHKAANLATFFLGLTDFFRLHLYLYVNSAKLLIKWMNSLVTMMGKIQSDEMSTSIHLVNCRELLFCMYSEIVSQIEQLKKHCDDESWWHMQSSELNDMWKHVTFYTLFLFLEDDGPWTSTCQVTNQAPTVQNIRRIDNSAIEMSSSKLKKQMNGDDKDAFLSLLMLQVTSIHKLYDRSLIGKGSSYLTKPQSNDVSESQQETISELTKIQFICLLYQVQKFGNMNVNSSENQEQDVNLSITSALNEQRKWSLSQLLRPLIQHDPSISKNVIQSSIQRSQSQNAVEIQKNYTPSLDGNKNRHNNDETGDFASCVEETVISQKEKEFHDQSDEECVSHNGKNCIAEVSNPWHAYVARKIMETNESLEESTGNVHSGQSDNECLAATTQSRNPIAVGPESDRIIDETTSQTSDPLQFSVTNYINMIPIHFQTLE